MNEFHAKVGNNGVQTAIALSFAIAISLGPQFAGANAAELVPHKAVYDVRLDSANNSAGLSGVSGRLVYEVIGNACEGYATNYRFLLQNQSESGKLNTFDSRTTSFEDIRNGEYRFFHKFYQNEILREESSGFAVRDVKELSVELGKPEEAELKLDGGTLFPLEHTVKTIREARSGTTFFSDELYDGSEDGQTHYTVTAVIGPSSISDTLESEDGSIEMEALKGERYWPITFAYFNQESSNFNEQAPDFQYLMKVYENGIVGDFNVKYADYGLLADISELEILSAGECES